MKNYKVYCDEKSGICSLVSDMDIGYLDNIKKEKVDVYLFSNPIFEINNNYYIDLFKFYLSYSEYINFNLVIGNNPLNNNNILIKIFELAEQINEIKAFQLLNFAKFYKNYLDKDTNSEFIIKEILDLIGCTNKDVRNFNNLYKANDLIASDIDFTNMFKIKDYPSLVMINEKNQGLKIFKNHNFIKYQTSLNKLIIDKKSLVPLEIPNFGELIDNVLLISQDEIEYLYGIVIDDFHTFIKNELYNKEYEIFTVKNKNFITLKNIIKKID